MARHRLDNPPAQRVRWLVCNGLGDGCDAASNLRRCASCGRQVWVSLLMSPLVDSGELTPRCWDCQARAGAPVKMHDLERAALAASGELATGEQVISQANAWLNSQQFRP